MINEIAMTAAQVKKKEEIVKSMKKNLSDFQSRYGDRAKEVMYATATKLAMKAMKEHEELSELKHSTVTSAFKKRNARLVGVKLDKTLSPENKKILLQYHAKKSARNARHELVHDKPALRALMYKKPLMTKESHVPTQGSSLEYPLVKKLKKNASDANMLPTDSERERNFKKKVMKEDMLRMISELSQKTLRAYIPRAMDSADKAQSDKNARVMQKRDKGVVSALKKTGSPAASLYQKITAKRMQQEQFEALAEAIEYYGLLISEALLEHEDLDYDDIREIVEMVSYLDFNNTEDDLLSEASTLMRGYLKRKPNRYRAIQVENFDLVEYNKENREKKNNWLKSIGRDKKSDTDEVALFKGRARTSAIRNSKVLPSHQIVHKTSDGKGEDILKQKDAYYHSKFGSGRKYAQVGRNAPEVEPIPDRSSEKTPELYLKGKVDTPYPTRKDWAKAHIKQLRKEEYLDEGEIKRINKAKKNRHAVAIGRRYKAVKSDSNYEEIKGLQGVRDNIKKSLKPHPTKSYKKRFAERGDAKLLKRTLKKIGRLALRDKTADFQRKQTSDHYRNVVDFKKYINSPQHGDALSQRTRKNKTDAEFQQKISRRNKIREDLENILEGGPQSVITRQLRGHETMSGKNVPASDARNKKRGITWGSDGRSHEASYDEIDKETGVPIPRKHNRTPEHRAAWIERALAARNKKAPNQRIRKTKAESEEAFAKRKQAEIQRRAEEKRKQSKANEAKRREETNRIKREVTAAKRAAREAAKQAGN